MNWDIFFKKPKIKNLIVPIEAQLTKIRTMKTIYPPMDKVYNAFNLTPFEHIKIVILGQDPYHGANQANGLAFSVNQGIPLPPSLKNIYKAIAYDYPTFEIPSSGDLSYLAKQGVFLLNATLTVEAHQANSHANIGWQAFTDEVIKEISLQHEGIVFLLWGNYAQRKTELIDKKKHHILNAVHPSPLSAHRGFLTCGHFKKSNELLRLRDLDPIDWTKKSN